jgi:hypothetical protein
MDIDPAPTAPGYFLSGVNPDVCFLDRNRYITDADADWLDDSCEYQLATAFSPAMFIANSDGCPGWEPYWAAKYFNTMQVIRIAYMMAYYRDCGSEGHEGDSEFITVEVGFDDATRHWTFLAMWTSAHYKGSLYQIHDDDSRWWNPARTMFSDKELGHPIIWVSIDKHANYPDPSLCNTYRDSCSWQYTARRVPILQERNSGSRHRDLVGCVTSGAPHAYANRCESFYTSKRFNGWYRVGCYYYNYSHQPPWVECSDSYQENCNFNNVQNYCWSGVTPYAEILLSDKFEERAGNWGPGPYGPYDESSNWPHITGPQVLSPGQYGTWNAAWTGRTLTQCTWYVDDVLVSQGGCTYSASFSSASYHYFRVSVVTDQGVTGDGPNPDFTLEVSDGGPVEMRLPASPPVGKPRPKNTTVLRSNLR